MTSKIEASNSPSTSNFSEIENENGFEASTSSSTHVAGSDASSKLAIDVVVGYIDDVLSAISSKKSSKLVDSGMKLKDMVEPLASDFSKLCEGISQGAKMFSDQKFITSSLSGEAHTMAVDVLKGVGNAHWAAVGLLAIANVLERLDKISSNDRECIDLLKGMLDLAKFIKMVKEVDAHFHKEILEKMSEALHLIVSGAILCHSFIRCNRISKFLSTKKICEELVYLRGKIDRMKVDMVLQMNYMFISSRTFHLSRNQQITADDGGLDGGHATDTGEIYETKIYTITETVCVETQPPESDLPDISDKKSGFQLGARLVRTFIALGNYLMHTANGLRRIGGQRFDQCRKPVHTLSINQNPSHLTDDSPPLTICKKLLTADSSPVTIEGDFTFNELRTATKGFRRDSVLGEGGFGVIYEGKLTDQRRVVIKRSRDVSNVLQRELECIINLKHPNILTLVGSCIHEDELLLVYDFMPKGNLSDLLFRKYQVLLDWPTREKIIDGVLRGLVYLHAEASIVHRDIKPTNILLDENFNAKVSDFGIARKLPKEKSKPKDNKAEEEGVYVDLEEEAAGTHHSTGVAGTLGYVAPECMMTGNVTRKADIYSLGLLLLNVVSGERCLKLTSIKEGMQSLISLAWKLHNQNRPRELIDARLLNTEGFNSKKIIRTIRVALWCIQVNPSKRPTASRIVEMLSSNEKIPRARQHY